MEIVENATVISVYKNKRNGSVTITYGMMDHNQMMQKHVVTLVTGKNTKIRDQFGKRISLSNLRKGMLVNARFSSMMTRSNPPQAAVYYLTIVKENESSIIEEGNVLEVEWLGKDYHYLLTGDANDINRQMRYVITDSTLLRDRRGNPIPFKAIRPGQLVRIERASFQTMSIPPQTTAFTVQIISSNETIHPYYD